jgi:hypothetical protein
MQRIKRKEAFDGLVDASALIDLRLQSAEATQKT